MYLCIAKQFILINIEFWKEFMHFYWSIKDDQINNSIYNYTCDLKIESKRCSFLEIWSKPIILFKCFSCSCTSNCHVNKGIKYCKKLEVKHHLFCNIDILENNASISNVKNAALCDIENQVNKCMAEIFNFLSHC